MTEIATPPGAIVLARRGEALCALCFKDYWPALRSRSGAPLRRSRPPARPGRGRAGPRAASLPRGRPRGARGRPRGHRRDSVSGNCLVVPEEDPRGAHHFVRRAGRKYSDLAVVGALLVVNAVLSFVQERHAAGVVDALRKRLQVTARVLRDAAWQVIPARDLVPGDLIRVRPGDIIPADVKLLDGTLSLDQSALTGESRDAAKAPGDVLSSGSIVRRGEGNGLVMLTGAKTYFGRTTELVQTARPRLHVEAVVAKVVRWLFVIVGALVAMVIALSLVRGSPLLEMMPLMLVLLMSAVPVALPVIFTVSMAVRLEGAGQARGAGHAPERDRGRRHHGRAVRRQDGHDHDEPAGRHRRDSVRARDRVRRAGRRRAGVPGGQPGSDRPGLPRRGEGASPLRRCASGHARLLRAFRRQEPPDGSRDRTERAADAGHEGSRADRRRGLRAAAAGHRCAGGTRQRIGAEGVPDAGGRARPGDGRPGTGRPGVPDRSRLGRTPGSSLPTSAASACP